jgi:D-sedoheptulose 7-phosphate isomerase
MEAITGILKEAGSIIGEIESDGEILETLGTITECLITCFRNGNKVMFCGNGGSAAEAQHLAAELSGRFYLDRRALPAEALHVNSSYITAVANDYSFSKIYSRYIAGVGKKGDVLIGLSASGNSENIVEAFHAAGKKGISTIAFTGKSGGLLKQLSDYIICIPSDSVPRIQEMHLILGHIICEKVEQKLFEKKEAGLKKS